MPNKDFDDASLWWESRHSKVQDYEIPEPPADEIPEFIDTTTTVDESVEYISDRDVKSELNMIRLNEPLAELVVSLMDTFLPLVLMLTIKGTDKEDVKLDNSERDTLVQAWAQYLKTTSFNLSPGGILITSVLTIYGAKVTMAIMNKGDRSSELQALREQNELLKQSLNQGNGSTESGT